MNDPTMRSQYMDPICLHIAATLPDYILSRPPPKT